MLDNDSFTPQFINGTIYQAFLNSYSIHRWHSPVSGTVVSTKIIEGIYYSETLAEGMDSSSFNES